MIKERTLQDIAEEVDCTLSSVGRALERHGIPRRPPGTSARSVVSVRELIEAQKLRAEEEDRRVSPSVFLGGVRAVVEAWRRNDTAMLRGEAIALAALLEWWAESLPVRSRENLAAA